MIPIALIAINTLAIGINNFYPLESVKIGLTIFLLVTSLASLVLASLRIRKYQVKVPHFASETSEIDLNWLIYIIIGILLLHLSITIHNIVFYPSSLGEYINLFVLIIVYFAGFHALKQKEIYPKDEKQRLEVLSISTQEDVAVEKRKLMTDEELIHRKANLVELMTQEQPFLDSEINLSRLAKIAEHTPHQLSYVINRGFNENFFQFINRYRVERAKELLVSKTSSKFSMVGIAFESGFNSKTSFNTTFKKLVGKTPSEYKDGDI